MTEYKLKDGVKINIGRAGLATGEVFIVYLDNKFCGNVSDELIEPVPTPLDDLPVNTVIASKSGFDSAWKVGDRGWVTDEGDWCEDAEEAIEYLGEDYTIVSSPLEAATNEVIESSADVLERLEKAEKATDAFVDNDGNFFYLNRAKVYQDRDGDVWKWHAIRGWRCEESPLLEEVDIYGPYTPVS